MVRSGQLPPSVRMRRRLVSGRDRHDNSMSLKNVGSGFARFSQAGENPTLAVGMDFVIHSVSFLWQPIERPAS